MSKDFPEARSSQFSLVAMIILAAVLSGAISACSRQDAPAVSVAGDASRLFQEKTIGRYGLLNSRKVALTFDDGPTSKTTSLILDLLKMEEVRASFFVVGKNARRHPELLARIRREGHILGNHSYSHTNLGTPIFSEQPERLIEEILGTHQAIAPFLKGQRHPYFRAPFGAWKAAHASALNKIPELESYIGPIFWTAGGDIIIDGAGVIRDASDWACWQGKRLSVAQCADGYMNAIERHGGGVVLMHDIFSDSLALASELIRRLKEAGYTFVTLDELETLDEFQ